MVDVNALYEGLLAGAKIFEERERVEAEKSSYSTRYGDIGSTIDRYFPEES